MGRGDFISNTTWLPSASGSTFHLGINKQMTPGKFTIVGQICDHKSSFDPFATVNGWSLPSNIGDTTSTLAITDPWTFNSSLHRDFLRATQNLQLLTESVTFLSFGQSFGIRKTLDMEQLYNDLIVLHITFFHQKVFLLLLLLTISFDMYITPSENYTTWYASSRNSTCYISLILERLGK